MANRLIQILRFSAVAPGGIVSQAHSLNINGVAVIPDLIEASAAGFIVTADATNVTVQNNNAIATDIDVWAEHKHSILRVFGAQQTTALTPQPFVSSPGTNAAAQNEGNTVLVDAVFGNDATGVRQGTPFRTVAAGLAAALAGDVVLVRPGTYDLAAGITIPQDVALIGECVTATIIRMLNVTADTTLVTLSLGAMIGTCTLQLTSAEHHTLVGVDFPGASAESARVREVNLTVDNSGAGAGNSDIFAIQSNGTGIPLDEITNLHDIHVEVISSGTGTKRGIYLGGPSQLVLFGGIIHAHDGSGIAVETNNAGAIFLAHSAIIHGTDADISETLGTLSVGADCDLQSENANGLGFTTPSHPNTIQWGDPGNLPNGTRYFYPGTSQVSATIVQVRLPSAAIIKGLSVQVQTAPGAGNSTTFTLQKNGVDTSITVTLSNADTEAVDNAHSVGFAAGDKASLKVVNNGATADSICITEVF